MHARSGGVVVITSALHADGREFDPRPDLSYFYANDKTSEAKLKTDSTFRRRIP